MLRQHCTAMHGEKIIDLFPSEKMICIDDNLNESIVNQSSAWRF